MSMDYTDFKERDAKEVKKSDVIKPASNRWWLAPEEHMPAAILAQVGAIIKADLGRIDSYNTYARLYGTFTPTFWNGYQLANSGRPTAPVRDRLTYNISQSATDTLVSMMSENKPKPMFLTEGGDSKLQQRAKKLDAYCYGLFYQNNYYQMKQMQFRDACVFGEGIIHCFAENGIIKFERVLPYEILVDYLESHYGPQSTLSLHRIKNIDRTLLAEMFPEKAKQIAGMSNTSQFISAANRSVADTVTVIESWRLPSSPEKPGIHVITTENTILHQEDYEETFFPFSIQRYCPRLYGFYGQSLVEQLVPSQVEINRTLISIQRSLYLGGTHKIFVKNGSKVIKSHFDNLIGTILEYAGDTPPQYIVPQLVQPEIYAHLNNMIGLGYQLPGISQMNATSMKTPGVNSGRAMRTEQNINTQRHNTLSEGYNQAAVDLAQITVSVARREYQAGRDIKVKVPGRRFIQTINWSEVDLADDAFMLQIYPTSKLPKDPEGLLSTIQEMMQGGLIDAQTGRRLLDYPDLEAEENLSNASRDYLGKILDDIVDHGKYTAPDGDDDLVTAKRLVLEYIAKGKLNNLDAKRLEQLRTFNKTITQLTTPPVQAGPDASGAMGAPPVSNPNPSPMGVPNPPEQSDLIPNIPG